MNIACPRGRRGNYSLLFLFSLGVVLGFGALAIDVSYILQSRAQAQDVSDAASQAGLVVLRQTGDQSRAIEAAERIVSLNRVAGEAPTLHNIEFGTWDHTDSTFTRTTTQPNAVRTLVGRQGTESIQYTLAKIWGLDSFEAMAPSTSAARSSQILFAMDITHSWSETDFALARDAAIDALELIAQSANIHDEVGMLLFANRYAWVYTPFRQIRVSGALADIRSDWQKLARASNAGFDARSDDGVDCRRHYVFDPPNADNFDFPPGGCYPDMPRKYADETGTSHANGLRQAYQMYNARSSDVMYRSLIFLTDGLPSPIPADVGTARTADTDYVSPFPMVWGPVDQTPAQIRLDSTAESDRLWDNLTVNTWLVSYRETDAWLDTLDQGDGYFAQTSDARELSTIFQQIISELPLAIVE